MEPIKPSWYIGKIMTYQAGISHVAKIDADQIPSTDYYRLINWSGSATIDNMLVFKTSNGVVTYLQSKEHSAIWIRLDDKMSISEG